MDDIVSSSRFYVYALYRPNSQSPDGSLPFYIGKGSGERMYAHFACAHKHAACKHMTCRVIRKVEREGGEITAIKIADGISEQAAFRLEQLFISYGVVYGWPLVNQTIGGEGVSGYQRTPEQRAERKRIAQQLAAEGKFDHLKTVNKGRVHSEQEREMRREHVTQAWSNPELLALQSRQSKQMWESSEYRERHRQAMSEPEAHEKLAYWKGKESPQAKTYPGFMSPDGTLYTEVKNLTHFAREHGLQVSGLCLVAQGKVSQHLGWTLYPPLEKHPYKGPGFVSPSGEIFADIAHLSHFCEVHGLRQNVMSEVASGKRRSHNGWTRHNPERVQPPLF